MCVLDADRPALDAQDAIGRVAELEDIARKTLDGEVFIDGSDELRLGLEHHLIVGGVGNGPARSDGRQARATTGRTMWFTAS